MTTLNVSLPEQLKKVADERVAAGRFASHSEYVRNLIRNDQKREARLQLEARLLERIASGESVPMGKKDFARIRTRLKRHLLRRSKGKG